ncbi:expansin EXLX1 family cellulose-binding protein [Gynuella sp.]|uniref:expansin EXLX1 family cellulose-binding protein n=1 Tax=Gynuella sp. TaxID=2969146 RepID=UPI003D116CF5
MSSRIAVQYLIPIFLFTTLFTSAQADNSTHNGEGTFYGYDGGGNCSYVDPPDDILTAAMNATDYDNSAACGGVIVVTNENTGLSVTVRIDDQCPECAPGDVDLSQDAFAEISELVAGRIPIHWHYIANPIAGNMKLYFKEGSSQWWTAVQVRDHLYPIKSLGYRISGSGADYTTLPRKPFNYFLAESGFGIGPYDFKITDFWDQSVEVAGISLQLTTEIDTGTQFPAYNDGGNDNGGDDGSPDDNGGDTGTEQPAQTTLSIVSSWDGGYCANMTITNPNDSPLTWTIEQDIGVTITNLWNAEWSQTGTILTASGSSWNATLTGGASTEFGFCGNE